jgi:hypothetical protein
VRDQINARFNERADEHFRKRLELCLARFPDCEAFRPRSVIVRQLGQRWGSMTAAGRLVLNRSLVQASTQEIDYVITHELCHRAFHHHGPAFHDLLSRIIPDWEKRKRRLELRLADSQALRFASKLDLTRYAARIGTTINIHGSETMTTAGAAAVAGGDDRQRGKLEVSGPKP